MYTYLFDATAVPIFIYISANTHTNGNFPDKPKLTSCAIHCHFPLVCNPIILPWEAKTSHIFPDTIPPGFPQPSHLTSLINIPANIFLNKVWVDFSPWKQFLRCNKDTWCRNEIYEVPDTFHSLRFPYDCWTSFLCRCILRKYCTFTIASALSHCTKM